MAEDHNPVPGEIKETSSTFTDTADTIANAEEEEIILRPSHNTAAAEKAVSAPAAVKKEDVVLSVKPVTYSNEKSKKTSRKIRLPRIKGFKRIKSTTGCLLSLLILIAVTLLIVYLVRNNSDNLKSLKKSVDNFMIDNNLAHDGGDAPWKHGGEAPVDLRKINSDREQRSNAEGK